MINMNAVHADEISVKLRLMATNAKLERSPANILAAITALTREYADLMGIEDAAYEVFGATALLYAEDRYMGDPSTENIVALGLEALVNMRVKGEMEAGECARIIVTELSDMELID